MQGGKVEHVHVIINLGILNFNRKIKNSEDFFDLSPNCRAKKIVVCKNCCRRILIMTNSHCRMF